MRRQHTESSVAYDENNCMFFLVKKTFHINYQNKDFQNNPCYLHNSRAFFLGVPEEGWSQFPLRYNDAFRKPILFPCTCKGRPNPMKE